MGPIERELRRLSEKMAKDAMVHGHWFPNLWAICLPRDHSIEVLRGETTVDDWSDAIEFAASEGI